MSLAFSEATSGASSFGTRALVVRLCRWPLTKTGLAAAASCLSDLASWDELFEQAVRMGVAPAVLANLRAHSSQLVPPEAIDRVLTLDLQARANAVAWILVLLDLLEDFHEAEIPVIVMKGPAVAIAGYGDPLLRPVGDYDLLVPEKSIFLAADVIASRGYQRVDHGRSDESLVRNQDALEFWNGQRGVELHCGLLSRHLGFPLKIEEVWEQSREIDCLSGTIRVLSTEHLFLYLCAHGAKHEWSLLRWISDIAQIEARLSTAQREAIATLAARTNTRRLLALAVRISARTFGDVSGFNEAQLVPDSHTAGLVQEVCSRLEREDDTYEKSRLADRFHAQLGTLLFWIRARERVLDRLECLARVVLIPPELDRSTSLADWILRPAHLVRRAANRFIETTHR